MNPSIRRGSLKADSSGASMPPKIAETLGVSEATILRDWRPAESLARPHLSSMMERARWDRIQGLFHHAVELAPPEQRSFLEAECADDRSLIPEVLSMVDEDGRGGSLLDRDVGQVAEQVLGAPDPSRFKRVGPYRILRVLGEGGMGVVYLAERKDLQSKVAIKVLRDAWISRLAASASPSSSALWRSSIIPLLRGSTMPTLSRMALPSSSWSTSRAFRSPNTAKSEEVRWKCVWA